MASEIINSKFLNAVNKPLEDFNVKIKILSNEYEEKEIKKRRKEIEGFVKKTKYVLNEINKLKRAESTEENKCLLKFNIVKLIKIQSKYLMNQASLSSTFMKNNAKEFIKGLSNSVNLINNLIDKFSMIKVPDLDLTFIQKAMSGMAVMLGQGVVVIPQSYSIDELSNSISGNAKIIKDNAEVLFYYFTNNGKRLHNKSGENRFQLGRIREAVERIKQCLEKLKKIS